MVDIVEIEIWPSAYRHGWDDPDILHAFRNRVKRIITPDDMVMVIGPAQDATMLEIGIGRSGMIVHAMKARKQYWP